MKITELVNNPILKPESSHAVRHGRAFTSPSYSQAFFGDHAMARDRVEGKE